MVAPTPDTGPMSQPAREIVRTSGGGLSAGARAVARGLRRPTLAPGGIAATAGALDAAAVALGLWFGAFALETGFDPVGAAGTALAGAAGAVALAWLCYGYRLSALRRFWRGTATVLAGAALAALVAGVPGAVVAVLAFLLPARLLGSTLAAAALDFGLTERRAVVIGGGERAAEVVAALADAPDNDIRICGIFDDRDDSRSPPVVVGVPKLGTLESLVAFARSAELDMLIVTLPLTAERRIREILKAVEVLPIDVRLSDFSSDPGFRRRTGMIDVMTRPMGAGDRAAKRAFDLLGASLALVALAPVLALTALAIRADTPGPVLFRQPRHGYNHRPIEVWKFRSMHAADCDPAARRLVTRGDPRVTRVGRFIRRWSIDELPQLFNVLTGQLSLVGPRPHALEAVSSRQESFEAIVEGYAARHKVRPGVTGWAQIHGLRGEIDDPAALRARVEHDLYYIENWSLRLDLHILAVTPFRLLDRRGAY
jgi:Undecaprenyl-phosphate glucose phosphotransferase